jgi:hypothetical protein
MSQLSDPSTLAIYVPNGTLQGELVTEDRVLYYYDNPGGDTETSNSLEFMGLCETFVGLAREFSEPVYTRSSKVSTYSRRRHFLIFELEPDFWCAACFHMPSSKSIDFPEKSIGHNGQEIIDNLIFSRLSSFYDIFKVTNTRSIFFSVIFIS